MYFGNQGNTVQCFALATVAGYSAGVAGLFFFFSLITLKCGSNTKSLRLCTLGLPSVTLCIGDVCKV